MNGDKAENLREKCSTSLIRFNIKEVLLTFWPRVDCVLECTRNIHQHHHCVVSLGRTLWHAGRLVYVPGDRIDLNAVIVS